MSPLHQLVSRVLNRSTPPSTVAHDTLDVIYDIECYPNIFTVVIYLPRKDRYLTYEISERRNDIERFMKAMTQIKRENRRMVGFNNMGYDYPVMHALMNFHREYPDATWDELCKAPRSKSNDIINGSHFDRFTHLIWDNNQYCQQLDLFKIHHFDNVARSTSLKVLQFNMRSESITTRSLSPLPRSIRMTIRVPSM